MAILINTYLFQDYPQLGKVVSMVARKVLVLIMFFIGASLTKSTLKSVGVKPLIQGVVLWIVVAVSSLLFIMNF